MADIPAIEAEGLAKRFGATRALDGVNLSVPAGGILGLLGPNGAGKTTVVRILATLLRPDAGRARILGADVVTQPGEVRTRIGLTGQYAALDDYLTGRANLIMIGRLARLGRDQAHRRADELLEHFDLTGAGRARGQDLFGRHAPPAGPGRQPDRAAPGAVPGRADHRAGSPEPLESCGRSSVSSRRRGTTVLLTTQYLDEADQLADQIAVINAGRVIAAGSPDTLKARIGEDRLTLVLAPGSDLAAAVSAVSAYAAEPVSTLPDSPATSGPRISAQVTGLDGITTGIVRSLDAAGVLVTSVTLDRPSLDDVFLTLTGSRAGGGQPAADPVPAELIGGAV